jgi:hypothetical protein
VRFAAVLIMAILWATSLRAQLPWEGIWLETTELCDDYIANKKSVRLSQTEMDGADFSCRITRIRKKGAITWELSLQCWDGEAPQKARQTLTLAPAGYLTRQDESGAEEELNRCTSISAAARASISERRKFLACPGAECLLKASEWRNLDTAVAWAIGRRRPEDAAGWCEHDKQIRRTSTAYSKCVNAQLAKPAVKISANCDEGRAIVDGTPYKLTDAAREGALRSSELSGYWDVSPPYSKPSGAAVSVMATWFKMLCPTTSADWNMVPER